MIRTAAVVALSVLLAGAAGCSTDDTAAPTTSTTTSPQGTVVPLTLPEPPAHTFEVVGKNVRVKTSSADPDGLLSIYSKVTTDLRATLAPGGYWMQIDCTANGARLANGHIGIGQLGVAQVGDLGKFDGVTGATCP
ncbi:hypothetical protein [Nocardia bovistercoris]|uniref:Uncharacterized protein n=1 Tax=Nocardia bovistercoris TaxID=2785916 RepID=A0A931IFF2_9NOCA|nr:hypothetical protein [Nocardia bovistercoris]MBH0778795.1 hypothetical protein [Nocardia bovistercoris]